MSVATGYMRNLQLAEDVLQDSLVKTALNAASFKRGTNGYAWLCAIVRNTALNTIKSENRRRGEDIDSFFDLSDGIDNFQNIENANAVQNALKSLP